MTACDAPSAARPRERVFVHAPPRRRIGAARRNAPWGIPRLLAWCRRRFVSAPPSVPAPRPRLHAVYYRFALQERVAFRGAEHVTGRVLGRMDDFRGRHYEVLYVVRGVRTRKWFNEAELAELQTHES